MSDQELPRWVTIKQAAEYYQLDPKTIRRMIAHGKLKARRVRSLFLLTADLRNRPPATLTERGEAAAVY